MRTGLQVARPTHALGQMIQAQQQDVPFLVTGTDYPTRDGSGLRDYIHVWDLAEAHVAALDRFDALPGPATVINLGSHHGPGTCRRIQPRRRSPIQARDGGRRPGNVVGAYSRIGRAECLLGWRARYDIADGIRHSLQWAAIRDEVLSDNEAAIVKEISSSER